MCDASERNTRAVFAIEQMMGAWCLDLGAIKSILTGTDCRHEPEGETNVQPDQPTATP